MLDIEKEFDLQLKGMLEDAEIKPSSRVWKGVASRLDKIGAAAVPSRPSYNWMRWAGAALAFGAVALGVFFSFPKHEETEDIALIAANDNNRSNDIDSILAIAENDSDKKIQTRKNSETFILKESVTPSVLSASATETVDTIQEGSSNTESSKEPKPGKDEAVKRSSSGEQASRYFAQLEYEEKQKERPANRAIYTKGVVGSNDGSGFRTKPMGFMAPAGTYSKSEISEISSSTYGVPVSFGLGVRFYILPKLSIGTGIDCSILSRTFTGKRNLEYGIGEAGNVRHNMVYLGIPLNLYYDVLDFENLKVYAYAGAEAEYCVSNKYTLYTNPNFSYSTAVKGLQYSLAAGLGVEFSLGRSIGLYLDPGIRYYLPSNQPKSIRTEKPMMFNFDAGLRFKF